MERKNQKRYSQRRPESGICFTYGREPANKMVRIHEPNEQPPTDKNNMGDTSGKKKPSEGRPKKTSNAEIMGSG